jgi:hypothetical protein
MPIMARRTPAITTPMMIDVGKVPEVQSVESAEYVQDA